jgi:hypothetical protein
VAVTSVEAGQDLKPGEPVSLQNGKAWLADKSSAIGITDPFGFAVSAGQWVLVLMHPAVSSSVRHAWELKDPEAIRIAIEDHEHTEWCRQACAWES